MKVVCVWIVLWQSDHEITNIIYTGGVAINP